ncbi:MAG TPA: methyltransferase domain-containing protein, partial [Miltoncostaeaceae bacterium]|nr:methyltransferase domain-containing protein [Miltoncostaeaceae bacterium]
GRAEDLPVGDGEADVVLSVFGVIFSGDPSRAAAELVRAARPGGTLALTAWVPAGAISEAGAALWEALSGRRYGAGPWGGPDGIRDLLTGAGARDVQVRRESLPFTAASPAAWLADQEDHHPVWRAARGALGDRYAPVHDRMLDLLVRGNEDPAAFRATSGYWSVRATR